MREGEVDVLYWSRIADLKGQGMPCRQSRGKKPNRPSRLTDADKDGAVDAWDAAEQDHHKQQRDVEGQQALKPALLHGGKRSGGTALR